MQITKLFRCLKDVNSFLLKLSLMLKNGTQMTQIDYDKNDFFYY